MAHINHELRKYKIIDFVLFQSPKNWIGFSEPVTTLTVLQHIFTDFSRMIISHFLLFNANFHRKKVWFQINTWFCDIFFTLQNHFINLYVQ